MKLYEGSKQYNNKTDPLEAIKSIISETERTEGKNSKING